MADLVNQLVLFFEDLVAAIGYPGIFGIMFLENVFPPVPTDPLMPFAGILAAEGRLSVWGVWLAAIAGALSGSLVLYMIGARLGEPAVRALIQRYGRYVQITEDQLDRALSLFSRYGGRFVFFGRALPVLRSAVSLTAGMSRMPVPKFLLYSGAMSALVTGFWTYAGYTLGENWDTILDGVRRYQTPLIAAAVVLALAGSVYAYGRYARRRAQQKAATSEFVEGQDASR